MARFFIAGLLCCIAPFAVVAQNNGKKALSDTMKQIVVLRETLRQTVLVNDAVEAEPLIAQLRKLSSPTLTTLAWDERWMLYHWTGLYAALFDEVRRFDTDEKEREIYTDYPPADSLFDSIDRLLYAHDREGIVGTGFNKRNEEEQEFATLHLAFLLRVNTADEKERRKAFMDRYPNSAFNPFIKAFMQLPVPPAKDGGTFDFGLFNANWNGTQIERTLKPGWGFQLGLGYIRKGAHINLRFARSYQQLTRELTEGNQVWSKGSATLFSQFSLEAGYNVFNTKKITIYPTLEGGLVSIKPPAIDEENIDAIPVSPDFTYRLVPFWGACITADIKFGNLEHTPQNRYNSHGFRLRTGFSRFDFSEKQALLKGNMFYFALLFQISG